MNGDILVLNSGSSSIKFGLYDADKKTLPLLGHGQIEGINGLTKLSVFDRHGVTVRNETIGDGLNHSQAMRALVDWGQQREVARDIAAVGHRVVHGGTLFAEPVRVDSSVLAKLKTLEPLAPLHQPHNLAGIAALADLLPQLPQVACFDTAFHRHLPELAQRFALPREYHEAGVRRYGFHGLSYEYIASVLPEIAGQSVAHGRVIVAHLGNGASLCALLNCHSVETTMGFTPLDGLPMGTRCGSLDPGVILYLQAEKGMNGEALSDLLYHRSGLLGMSGISNDMRTLLASKEPAAREAIDLYVYRINRELGAMTAALGGIDALVFTGGIGENAAPIREKVCALASWAGIRIDTRANDEQQRRISSEDSATSVWIIPTDEEQMIARHTREVLG